jgi:hypothetical protein
VALTLATVLAASACATPGDGRSPQTSTPTSSAPLPVCTGVPVDLSLPGELSQVRVFLYDASGVAGTAERVATELARFDYQVAGVSQYPEGVVPEVAVLRYGPGAVGKAWLLWAYFPEPVRLELDVNRDDDTVDVVVGQAFIDLHTVTNVNQSLADRGRPTAPPGTCDQDGS